MADTRKDVLQTQFEALDPAKPDTAKPYEWPDRGYGLREDKTQKGNGFMGMIGRPNDDMKSSELSIGVNIGGKDVLIPSIVPTLTKKQLDVLLALPPGTIPPRDIIDTASKYAQDRIGKGLTPFARVDEEGTFPVPTE